MSVVEMAAASRKGEDEEMEEVKEKAPEDGVVRWERFLPRESVRVLLVEPDDSTREILSALLRKCGYKVAAAADGIKAWETLKEEAQIIDLVLTEVELPSISGFCLLTMIMEHERCKNIPVIMMSSHDSINMVFKCMMKGLADFLVKPIRKNELRNLWQHVWRRYSSVGEFGGPNGNQDDNIYQQKFEADSYKNSASNHSSAYVASVKMNKEYSEKGSDTQSSCTRPGMEAQSTCMQNVQEQNQMHLYVQNDKRANGGVECSTLKEAMLVDSDEPGDNSIICNCNQANKECQLNQKCFCTGLTDKDNATQKDRCITLEADGQNFYQAKPQIEIVDLLGAMDNGTVQDFNLKGSSTVGDILKDSNHKLELSLSRSQPSSCFDPENNGSNLLNHSSSSAFSRYNSRLMQPTISASINLRVENEESFKSSNQYQLNHWSQNPTCASQSNGMTLHLNGEDKNSTKISSSSQDGKALQLPHAGIAPFTVPAVAYDNLFSGFGFPLKPMVSTHLGPPSWSLSSSTHRIAPVNFSKQSGSEILKSDQSHQSCDQIAKAEQGNNLEPRDDRTHLSSVTGQSGSSSICNGSRSHLNSSGGGSVCDGSSENVAAKDATRTTGESYNDDRSLNHGIRLNRSKRQEAVDKFKLKRKARCYNKRVRYQSRKELAEQRPRHKGQFVRQVRPDPQ